MTHGDFNGPDNQNALQSRSHSPIQTQLYHIESQQQLWGWFGVQCLAQEHVRTLPGDDATSLPISGQSVRQQSLSVTVNNNISDIQYIQCLVFK